MRENRKYGTSGFFGSRLFCEGKGGAKFRYRKTAEPLYWASPFFLLYWFLFTRLLAGTKLFAHHHAHLIETRIENAIKKCTEHLVSLLSQSVEFL